MKVFQELNKNKHIAIALGYFDGMHLGHKKVIQTLVSKARSFDIESAVITFEKNPKNYFNEEKILNLQSYKDKEYQFEILGVDNVYELSFEEYKEYTAEEYLELLIDNFQPEIIIVGYNHTFGKDKTGTPFFLEKNASKYGYECIVVPEQKGQYEETISSSEIREKVKKGQLGLIKKLLGRSFSVRNSVVKGKRLATTLGYPTANIIWPNSLIKLPYGVYFGYVKVDNKLLHGMISWGLSPTLTDGVEEKLEAHIYKYDGNLYGKIIQIVFILKIRDIQSFNDIRALKAQLDQDYKHFREWASKH